MPIPPTSAPVGLTTSRLQANQFFPSNHLWLNLKELNLQTAWSIQYLGKFEMDTSNILTSTALSSMEIPDGTDYVIIHPGKTQLGIAGYSAPAVLSLGSGTQGGLIIPADTIFNLAMPKSDLEKLVCTSRSFTVSFNFFKIIV
jgi:hypothetical protein